MGGSRGVASFTVQYAVFYSIKYNKVGGAVTITGVPHGLSVIITSFFSSSFSSFFFIDINSDSFFEWCFSGEFHGWRSDLAKMTNRIPVLNSMKVAIRKTFCHCVTVCWNLYKMIILKCCCCWGITFWYVSSPTTMGVQKPTMATTEFTIPRITPENHEYRTG